MVAVAIWPVESLVSREELSHIQDAWADSWAERAVLWFDELGLNEERHRALPPGIQMYFVMLIQLRLWELDGLTSFLRNVGLPSAAEAAKDFFVLIHDTSDAASETVDKFCRSILDTSINCFSSASMVDYSAEVALNVDNEDELIDELAEFIWARRHDS